MQPELRGRGKGLKLALPVLAGLGVALGGVPTERCRRKLVSCVVSPGGEERDDGRGVEAERCLGRQSELRLEAGAVLGAPAGVARLASQGRAITDNTWQGGRHPVNYSQCEVLLCAVGLSSMCLARSGLPPHRRSRTCGREVRWSPGERRQHVKRYLKRLENEC